MWIDPSLLLGFAPPADGQAPNPLVQFIPLILVFGVFYFVVFAPMRRRQKQHGEMLRALKAGDKVVTSGGIHGTIAAVTDDRVQLKIAESVKIEIQKSAISDRRDD